MSGKKLLSKKHFWSIAFIVPILIVLVVSMTPGTAHALTATPTRTATRTPTNTHGPGCGTTVVVTSTPTKTPSPTPTATPSATATRTPTPTNTACGPIFITATPTPMIAGDLGFGSVHGIVTNSSNGAPIAGALITCTHTSFTSPAKCTGTRTTAADGSYSFTNVFFHDTDQITVKAEASGFLPQTITQNFFTTANMTANFALVGGTPTLTPTRTVTPSKTPTALPPDLIVQSMGISGNQSCFGPGFALGVRVTIANINSPASMAFGPFVVNVNGATQSLAVLQGGQTATLWFSGYVAGGPNVATVDSTNVVGETNENNNTLSQQLPVPTPPPNCTPTPTPTGPTPTPTFTPTRTPTPTWTNTPVPGGDLCATPTVITGGGSYSVPASGVCFKYVNAAFSRGAMWSVMNGSDSTVSNVVKWYGGRNETVTNCINDTQTLNGNGAQINNFTVGKDSANVMYVTITTNKLNTVSMSIQNWQNGSGCSVAPTPHP